MFGQKFDKVCSKAAVSAVGSFVVVSNGCQQNHNSKTVIFLKKDRVPS